MCCALDLHRFPDLQTRKQDLSLYTFSFPLHSHSHTAHTHITHTMHAHHTQNVNIKDFRQSWSDGLAFCAILHSFLPDKIPYDDLTADNPRRNFTIAFDAAKYVQSSVSML